MSKSQVFMRGSLLQIWKNKTLKEWWKVKAAQQAPVAKALVALKMEAMVPLRKKLVRFQIFSFNLNLSIAKEEKKAVAVKVNLGGGMFGAESSSDDSSDESSDDSWSGLKRRLVYE